MSGEVTLEKLVSLSKRRGFAFQSSEIYGGFESCYDYGPLGVELKRRIADAWWRDTVMAREDVVGIDSAILQAPRVWEVSGHVGGFNDPLVDCRKCKQRFRADKLPDEGCPGGGEHDYTEARQFDMMFKTQVGPVEDSSSIAYLRPETAQGIFTNFLNVQQSMRMKLPFGIGQIGKAFRNEIVTGNFVFRTREFEQMEMEYFCRPEEAQEKFDYWVNERLNWYYGIGIKRDHLRGRPYPKEELAHYASACTDIEYAYPWGWDELEGVAYRTDYDLAKHAEATGKKLAWMDPATNEWIVPHVVEPAAGLTRIVLIALLDAYDEETLENGEERTVLRFHPRIAPVTLAVFPLVKKAGMPEKAREIIERYLDRFPVFYDQAGAIGRRYRRQDEVGTPWCATVDGDTLEDDTVTVRDRDTMEQVRVKIGELGAWIDERARPAQ